MRVLKVFAVLTIVMSSLAGARAQRQVSLGNATVDLTGPWKFHTGDNMAWAQPNFDDSAWGTMDLTPPPRSYDPELGTGGFVPGWTARGYPGYAGYAWYRLRVNIQDGQTALALKMPDNFDDAYQVYVNGELVGQFGRFTARGVTMYSAHPSAVPFPANVRGGLVTIAIRMWMNTSTPLEDPYAGGLHGPPVLGQSSVISGLLQLDWDAFNRADYGDFLEMTILLLALLVAFGLFWLDRTEPAYFWLCLALAATLALMVVIVIAGYTTWIGGTPGFLLTDAVLPAAIIALWVLFWAYWFRLDHMNRLHRLVWAFAVPLAIGMAMLRAPLYGTVVPVHAIVWLSPLTIATKLMLGALLVWVTVCGIRKKRGDGWPALPAVVLLALSLFAPELFLLHAPLNLSVSALSISLGQIGTVLSLIIITVLLLRRFLHAQRERVQLLHEIEQARSVQQVLIPEALPSFPGFTLESEYLPAQQVGGDFFQIVAHPTDGSILIVLGDVTGHGLQAAMLVSLLVGAIRNQTETSFDPLRMLQSLNRRLIGRGNAQATCLALRIAPDGSVTLANAGHLPPYLNGEEIAMEGAVPLGLMEGADFSVMEFRLQPGDRLALLTDGIVEAQNKHRELFGFARTNDLMRQKKTALEIAATAQAFGQQDDITVVCIGRRTA